MQTLSASKETLMIVGNSRTITATLCGGSMDFTSASMVTIVHMGKILDLNRVCVLGVLSVLIVTLFMVNFTMFSVPSWWTDTMSRLVVMIWIEIRALGFDFMGCGVPITKGTNTAIGARNVARLCCTSGNG